MTKLAIPLAVSTLGLKKAKSKLKLLQVVEAKENRRVTRRRVKSTSIESREDKKSPPSPSSDDKARREILLHL